MSARAPLAALAVLLLADAASTAAAPALGPSLTQAAHAADFTGKIKRVTVKKRRGGQSQYRVHIQNEDSDVEGAGSVASVGLDLDPTSEKYPDPDEVVFTSPDVEGVFESGLFSFDGAVPPEGDYQLVTTVYDADGNTIGSSQKWTATATDDGLRITSASSGSSDASVTDMSISADDCGNGRLSLSVESDSLDKVASVDVAWSGEGPLPEDDAVSVKRTGTLSTFVDSKLTISVGDEVFDHSDGEYTYTLTAYGEKGDVLGSVEGTAKYGEIMIDGVELEWK